MPIRKTEYHDKKGNWEIAYTQEKGCNDMMRLTYKDHTSGGGRSLPTIVTDCSPYQLRRLAQLLESMANELEADIVAPDEELKS